MVGRTAEQKLFSGRAGESGFWPAVVLAFSILVLSIPVTESAQTFSAGYLIGRSGELSRAKFEVTPDFPGENIPVAIYFSNPGLAEYFRMESASTNWNGGGFFGLTKTQTFYLSVESVPASLSFENHTVYVEINGVNHTVSYFPIPGDFYYGGRAPPPGVAVTRTTRQTYFVSPANMMKIPVEMGVYVW